MFFGPASARLLPRFCPASAPLLPGAPGASGCAWLAQPTANRWGAKSIARRRDIFSRSRYGRPFVCVCVFSFSLFATFLSPLSSLSISLFFSLIFCLQQNKKKREAVEIRCSIDSPIDGGSSNYPIQFDDNDRRWPSHIFSPLLFIYLWIYV